MKDFGSILYSGYIIPNIEDEEILALISELYNELPPCQQELCERIERQYVTKAFLLGVRTGAGLERFLQETPQTTLY